MRRLALAVVLLAGCGGGDEPAEQAQTAPPAKAPSTDRQLHSVANDVRDIAALTYGDCANAAAIRRAAGRLRHDAALLPVDAPPKAFRLVDRVLAQTRDTLRSC